MGEKLNFTILFLIFTMMFFQSCKKEDEYVPGINYTIYLDKQNRIIKRIEGSTSTTLYQYTDNTVMISDINYSHTYFLNDLSLADSCFTEDLSYLGGWDKPRMTYFKYYTDGYMEYNGEGSFWYKYADGNRTEAIQDSSISRYNRREYYYTYTSMPNIIDLEAFRGSFLGKINRNLISKIIYNSGTLMNLTVDFSYILDSKNYVKKRTEIFTAIGMPTWKSIRNYEYIFLDN
jgi:hypothetical protein